MLEHNTERKKVQELLHELLRSGEPDDLPLKTLVETVSKESAKVQGERQDGQETDVESTDAEKEPQDEQFESAHEVEEPTVGPNSDPKE